MSTRLNPEGTLNVTYDAGRLTVRNQAGAVVLHLDADEWRALKRFAADTIEEGD